MRQAFVDMTKYLPLDSVLLKSLSYLNPEKLQDHASSSQAIRYIAQKFQLANEEVDAVITEWEMFFINDNKPAKCDRIDHCWRQLFDMERGITLKYPKLSGLLKMALVLPHSNADVERSLCEQQNCYQREVKIE